MKRAFCTIISFIFIILIFCSSALSASASTLPSAYNNVPSNLQYITSVKSQGDYGNCWAFAAIACCEADAVKNHGANKTETDFSELHLAYFSYNGTRDNGDKITSFAPFYENGGFSQLPVFTFSNWIGLVDETVAKYSDFTKNPSIQLNEDLMYGNVKYYIKGAYNYSLPDEISEVKEAIRTYGAVQTAYFSSESYLNELTYAQYCPNSYTSDHAVAIVGWDDNYSRTNFKSSARPQKNGAWLVKNSWSTRWGLNGYFWISYEDKSLISATAFDVVPAEEHPYDNNYQHDGGLSLTYSAYEKTSAANVYTAKGNEELLAIGITTYDIKNANYSLKIYLNPNQLSPSKFNSGAPIHEQSGTITETGFTTIPLTSSIILNKGDTFIIFLETNAHLALDSDQDIKDGSTLLVRSDASVLKDQTYFSVDGCAFYDASSTQNGANPFNARIKAFTKNISLGDMLLKSLPTASKIEFGQTLNSSTLSDGEIIDTLSQKAIRGKWSFKTPTLIPKNGENVKVIFTPDNADYGIFETDITISVTESTPKLTLNTNKTSYRGGDTVSVSATVKNPHSQSLTDLPTVKFYYQINDGEKIFFDGSFNLPKDISGKKITIAAITEKIDGKYAQALDSITFSTEATSNNSNTTNVPSATDETFRSDTSDLVQNNENNENNENNKNNENDLYKGDPIYGCLSSASASAILIVCAIGGFAAVKKRKDD